MIRVILAITVLSLLTAAGYSQTDLRIRKKTVTKVGGAPMVSEADLAQMPASTRERLRNMADRETTVLIKGARMRTDAIAEKPSSMKMKKVKYTFLDQCDKRRMVIFNDDEKKYTVSSYGAPAQAAKADIVKSKKPSSAARGKINVVVTGTDTGERMELFGYDARRIRQRIIMTPSGNSCLKSPMTIDTDGWYADVPSYSCALKQDAHLQEAGGNCTDEVSTEVRGVAVTGIPVKEVRTIYTDGNSVTIEEEVVELTRTSLDQALFEVPAGYVPSNGSAPLSDHTADAAPSAMAPASSLAPPAAGMTVETADIPKKPGSIRLGIAAPTAEMGNDFDAGNTPMAVRNTLAVALKNDNVETVILDSGLPEQEAKQKECNYIFYSKVTRKKGGGGFFGSMGPMLAGAAAGMIPGVGGVVASVATSTVMTASAISGGFKSKDEIGFEYRVMGLDGTALIPANGTKQKAKKNGEDVLTPQIQQAATATLAKVVKP